MMDLDQLQSVRDRERQTDKLQQLRESFYADTAALVADLREERDRAAASAEDPFDDPRVSRLTDQINTAEQTVEAIYEKRVGKLVKAASFAAADLPAETEGMTTEEQDLFDDLVEDIRTNRRRVLDVLAGEEPEREADPSDGDASGSSGVDPAGMMGGKEQPPPAPPGPEDAATGDGPDDGGGESGGHLAPDNGERHQGGDAASAEAGHGIDGVDGVDTGGAESERGEVAPSGRGDDAKAADGDDHDGEEPGSEAKPPEPLPATSDQEGAQGGIGLERTTVRITTDVGEVFGVDERAYDLESDQIVDLPTANAEPLLEQNAAERVE